MTKELTQSILAILIVGGAIVSLFIPEVTQVGSRLLQSLATLVIGYYYGVKGVPFGSLMLGSKKTKKK